MALTISVQKPAAFPAIKVYYQTPFKNRASSTLRHLHYFEVENVEYPPNAEKAIKLVREQIEKGKENLVGPILALIQGR